MSVAAPSGLIATPVSAKRIDLAWVNGQVYDSLYIERKEAGGSYALLQILIGTATAHQDDTCEDGKQYYYQIRGEWISEYSPYSSEANAITPLPAPTGPSGTCLSSTEIKFDWKDRSKNETAFEVYIDGSLAATKGANIETHTATGLAPGTWYGLKVRAKNAVTYSSFTAEIFIFTANPPSAPSNTVVTPTGTTTGNVAWQDKSSNETGFKVERSAIGPEAGFAQIGTVGPGVTIYQDTGLTSNKQYWYRVRAYNDSGDSGYSNVATGTTFAAIAQPTNLALTAAKVAGSYGVESVFDDNSSGEDSHILERGTGTFSGNAVANPAFENWVNANQANDWTNVYTGTSSVNREATSPHGGTYCARLDIDAGGSVCLIGQAITLAPGAGQRVSFWYKTEAGKTAVWLIREGGLADAGNVSLGDDGAWYTIANSWQVLPTATAWTKVELEFPAHSGYSTYTIWLGHAPGTSVAASSSIWFDDVVVEQGVFGTTVATLAANRTYYLDTGVVAGNAYRWRVKAVQGAVSSAYSNEVIYTVPAAPAAPADLTVSEYQDEWARITWTEAAGSTGTIIEVSDESDSTGFVEYCRVVSGVESLKVFGLTAGTQYWVRLKAYNGAGASAYTDAETFTTRAAYARSDFDKLMLRANPPITYLVEVNPLLVITGWSLTSGRAYTYEAAFSELGASLDTVHEDGIELSELASIAAVEAAAGSWYHDLAAGKLYVHTTGGGSPADQHIAASFWLYFTTGPDANYGGNRYLPLVAADGIPNISQESAPVYEGGVSVDDGTAILVNPESKRVQSGNFFDRLSDRYVWINRRIIIRAGG